MRIATIATAIWLTLTAGGCGLTVATGVGPTPDEGPAMDPRSAHDGGAVDMASPGDAAMAPDGAMAPAFDGAVALDGAAPDLGGGFYPSRSSPIAAENQLPGSSGWQLTLPSAGLAAYADSFSVTPGAAVTVRAGAGAATSATWELWRLGHYGGARGRSIARGGPVSVPAAAPASLDPATGMVYAGWAASFTVDVPAAAVTGFYLIKLSTATAQSYVPLIVRELQPAAPILVGIPTNTYQAYNAWGGTSLYDNRRGDWSLASHAWAVSYDRPFAQGGGAGQLFNSDRDLITFVEAQGYDVGYATDLEIDAGEAALAHRRLAIAQGHSEYWTGAMRDHFEQALANGTWLAFFGANDAYWQVRWAPDHRSLIGYKDQCARDPMMSVEPAAASCQFRGLAPPRPENGLLGVMFGDWSVTSAPFRVSDGGAWLWSGAGASTGDLIAGLYGFEIDRRYANGFEPAGVFELGAATIEDHGAQISAAQTTIYTAPSGAMVLASASTDWSRLLAADGLWDARVQQATANFISRAAGSGALGQAALLPFKLGPAPAPPAYRPGVTVSTVSTVSSALTSPVAVAAAANGDAVVVDGNRVVRVSGAGSVTVVAGGATAGDQIGDALTQAAFNHPRGVAVRADGGVYVSDSSNMKIKLILGGAVTTVAGGGEGFADGSGTAARFDTPMGIALAPSGALIVADAWNHRIRAVDSAGNVTTWAGDGQVNVRDGAGAQAEFNFPFAVAARADGSVLVVDSETGLVRQVGGDAAHTVSTFAGELGRTGWQDGPASTASVMETLNVAVRASGEVVLLDGASWRLRGVASDGTIDTLAGGVTAAPVDGAGAQAGFQLPHAVAAMPDGSLVVADSGNHALRRVSTP